MKANYEFGETKWSHWIDHEMGKQYEAEREANKIAQQHANERGAPVTVIYRHEGCLCAGCDDDGYHRNTFDPLPKN